MTRPHGQPTRRGAAASLLEWAVVTLILIVAIYAILQVVGPDVQRLIDLVAEKLF